MVKFVCVVSLLTVIATNAVAIAGDVLEARVCVDERPSGDAKQPPAAPPVDPPKDAKVVSSIESLVGADGDVHAKCVIEGKTVSLKGHVTTQSDGKRRIKVEFSEGDVASTRHVATTLDLAMDEQKILGSLPGSGGARLVVVTIKAEEKPANRKAE